MKALLDLGVPVDHERARHYYEQAHILVTFVLHLLVDGIRILGRGEPERGTRVGQAIAILRWGLLNKLTAGPGAYQAPRAL